MNSANEKKAAVLVHGFLGHAGIFDFLLPVLQKNGWEPIALTLPGHGGDLAHFCRYGRSHWQQHVDGQLAQIGERYEKMAVVTHSMGGLLTLCSLRLPQKARVFALALPLRIRMKPSTVRNNLRALTPSTKTVTPQIEAARRQLGVSGLSPFNTAALLPNTLGLLQLVRLARRRLKNGFTNPLTAVYSAGDGLVSPRSKKLLEHLPNVRFVTLQESEHFYFSPPEHAAVTDALEQFLSF